MLRFEKVRFSYPGRPVFDGLDLTLPDGSRTALLAPSGTGKTTLLRLLTGQLRPQSGAVTGIPAEGIAMVFQEDRLLPGRTALENLRFVRPDLPGEEGRALLRELGLAGWEDSLPGSLSGGMRRRVAIARALCFSSGLLVLDEPFQGLDEATWERTLACVDRHAAGRTLLLVTHRPDEAERLGCRAVALSELPGVCPAVPPAETP